MSDAFASSSHLQSSSSTSDKANVFPAASTTSTPDSFTACVGQSSAGPSTWRTSHPYQGSSPIAVPSRRSTNVKKRTTEEQEIMEMTSARMVSRLASDHALALYPDVDAPFRDTVDVVNRLLPYHVFQHPKEDLDDLIKGGKGKRKATEEDIKKEIEETKFALECHRRLGALEAKFRSIRTRPGKRAVPDAQAVLLASLALDTERSETTLLNNELRTARAELERREKEKRIAANAARSVYYGPAPTIPASSMPAQYYRPYPYPYTQVYGTPPQSSSTSTFSVSPAPTSHHTPAQSAIPVQLPVASLPALHALGIVPVPAASVPPDGHPQPPAVLRGSTSNVGANERTGNGVEFVDVQK
ncbi:putative conserved region of unknown function on GLTSCR protein [Lyophyllum shimeji]|uniref:GLTSCR protein conserved domain-containing protein n=1 Tax=Lyophyllum shimeji TaxID=47721 RepID=A0A9P3PKP8_LYOSH|nr:putative conserved region of unknown function on GLTSCR protein [Lyophyllum shimeji]